MILKEVCRLVWLAVVILVIINFDYADHKTTLLVISSLVMVFGAFALTTGIRLIIDGGELSERGFMSAAIGSIIMAFSLIIWEGDRTKWFFVSFLGFLGIYFCLWYIRDSKT